MLLKNIIILLCCCVYSVISVSNFINKGERAELFELLDNEVGILKVSIPDDQFIDLKDNATNIKKIKFNVILPKLSKILKRYITELQKINFNEVFPGYNFTDNIPQLQIGEDGYAKYDIKKVVSEFDYNPENYNQGSYERFYKHFLETNNNFNLLEIIDTLKGIEMAEIDNKDEITSLLNIYEFIYESPEYKQIESSTFFYDYLCNLGLTIKTTLKIFKKVNFNDFLQENNFNEIYPELQIGEDGYAKFNIDEVMAGYIFDPEYYEEKYPGTNVENFNPMLLFYSNNDFNFLEISDKIEELLQTLPDGDVIMETALNNISGMTAKDEFYELSKYKTKNATMTFELNGLTKSFNKITFSLSGKYSRSYSKPNYKIKIRGGQDLYGRSHFKLRSDCTESTQLRTKLVSDIHNHLGIKSSSANYIQLYINDEYMGLYIITDLFKPSWVKQVYGDENCSSLYKCDNMSDLLYNQSKGCTNENEDITDNTEWINFLKAVQNAKSASDLEDIFEIDHFLYEMAIEYLLVGWDHIRNGHNFNFYKQPNGKWIYLSFDFDLDFGQFSDIKNSYEIKVNDFFTDTHIYDILIFQDPSRFEEILKDVVNRVFNPSTLFPRIDELKQFIKPYIELDKIANSDGKYPGRINEKDETFYSMEEWDAYTEFTPQYSKIVEEPIIIAYGLKYWVLMMYRNVCNEYKMECDPVYMDENYQYPINKDLEPKFIKETPNYYSTIDNETEIPTEIPTEDITSLFIEKETTLDTSEPTTGAEDESSDEEEKAVDVDVTTIGIDDDDSSSDEEENSTEFVETFLSLPTTAINTSTTIRTTITKTKTISYKTITN